LLGALLQSPEPHARVAAQTVQHHWYSADPAKGGGGLEEEVVELASSQNSGIIADTPEQTEIHIATLVEKMSYDVKDLTVKAGKKIRLTFANPDFMPHNLVIVQPGASKEVGMGALALGAEGFAMQFLPETDKIIAATNMLDSGTEQTIEFVAPTEPGNYEIICTFPGHFMVMNGILRVK
jgi:azurin